MVSVFRFSQIVLCLVVFFTFSHLAAQRTPASWELDWLKKLNAAGNNNTQDKLLYGVSQAIYPSTIIWDSWAITAGVIQKKPEKVTQGALRLLATGFATSATMLLKNSIHRERPDPAVFSVPFPFSGFSFPSGHTALAASIATTILIEKKQWYWCSAGIAGCLLIAYTRPYLGVHYPGDIIAGMVIGSGSALLTLPFKKLIGKRINAIYNKKPDTKESF